MVRAAVQKMSVLLREESGPTAVEYAVLLAMLVLVAVAAIGGIGSRVLNVYQEIETAVPD